MKKEPACQCRQQSLAWGEALADPRGVYVRRPRRRQRRAIAIAKIIRSCSAAVEMYKPKTLPLFSCFVFSLLCLIATLVFASQTAKAQQRPLITEDVEIVKPGSVRFDLGFDFLQDKDFTLSGLN